MTKILVIEDEEPILDNILELLAEENFEAIGAANGSLGLQLAKQHRPDLILCDIMMPELDGYGVLNELRSALFTATIPVIFLTAKDTREDNRKGMDLGADDYLTKPFTPAELLRSIATRLQKKGAYTDQYTREQNRANQLKAKVQELQQLSHSQEDLLQKISQSLRDPLSNINMAIQMLKIARTKEARDRYMKILQDECAREIEIINQVSHLQELLTPENAELLRSFNILKGKKNGKNISN